MKINICRKLSLLKKRLFIILSVIWLVFGLSCYLPASDHLNIVSVTSGGVLAQSDTRYVLDRDITASDTAFSISGSNVVLDLNGHTITFDDFPVGIENSSFEEGNAEVPSGWDLSKAPSARRVSNNVHAMTGKWHLEFRNALAAEEIVSTWTALPPGQWGAVYFQRGNAIHTAPDLRYSFLVECEDGSIVAAQENTTLEYGYFEFRIPQDKTGRYRLRFKVLNAPQAKTDVVRIDLLDLRAAHNFGIYMGYAGDDGDPGRRPDWAGYQTPANVSIMNGTIIQGRGGAFRGAAIYGYPVGNLTVRNVEFRTWGMETDAITIYYSNNGIIEGNVVASESPYKLNRGQLSSPINIFGGTGFKVKGNTVQSTTGWGCISLSDVFNSEVSGNVLKTGSTVVNHHAINAYNVRGTIILGNSIEADPGQGILLATNCKNNTVSGNEIHLKSQAPSPDIGRLSLDAIRLNDYDGQNVSGNLVVNNKIYINGYNDPFYAPGSQVVNGIANRGTGPGNVFEGNYIQVKVVDENVTGSGIEPGSLEANEVIFRNNVIESNSANVMFGGYVRNNHHSTFVSNTFIRSDEPATGYATPPEGGGSGVKGYATLSSRAGSTSMKNTHFIDTRLINGASLENLVFGHAFGDYSYFVDWYLTITVKNHQGIPLVGASVVMRDKNGVNVFSGQTDDKGQIKNIILNQYEHYGRGMAKTSYFRYATPHSASVTMNGYSARVVAIDMVTSRSVEIVLAPVGDQSGGLTGDLNGDGRFDDRDYLVLRMLLNSCQQDSTYMRSADFNGDGCITYADYVIWYGYFTSQR